jgi:hypothetical protein
MHGQARSTGWCQPPRFILSPEAADDLGEIVEYDALLFHDKEVPNGRQVDVGHA